MDGMNLRRVPTSATPTFDVCVYLADARRRPGYIHTKARDMGQGACTMSFRIWGADRNVGKRPTRFLPTLTLTSIVGASI